MKRYIAMFLSLLILVTMLPVTVVSASGQVVKYDATAALNYASSHWNDGVGECAEFVSKCVQAGGISISTYAGTGPCARAIMNAVGIPYTNEDTYGRELPKLVLDSSGNATKSQNSSILSAGDVVVQWCDTHSIAPHILLCAGYNSDGKAIFYAHNKALNMQTYNLSYNRAYQHTSSCDIQGRVIHFNTCSHEVGWETVQQNSAWVAQCKNCHSVFPIQEQYLSLETTGIGIYRVDGTNVKLSNSPYTEGKESKALAKGTTLTIVAYAGNAYGNLWMKTDDGRWVCYIWTNSTGRHVESITKVGNLPKPSAPTGLTYSGYTGNSFTISWSPVSGATSYKVEYKRDGIDWRTSNDYSNHAATSFTFYSATNPPYYIRVKACNAYGESDWSATMTCSRDHTHSWTTTTQNDAYTHNKVCSCGAVLGQEPHNFGNWLLITAATEQSAGTRVRSCQTCGYQQKENFYNVSYNPNGGYGAPGAEAKTYGVDLTLSSTVPMRDGYVFLGWSTSKNATSATYLPGDSYTANTGATLYAVWASEYPENAIPIASVEWRGHLYFLYDTPATWEGAKLFCEQQGGHLAVITSEAENNVIRNLIKRGSRIKYFLGGSDAANEGQFAWVTGENWSYTNWDEGEPNNGTETGQDYLQIYNFDGKYGLWDDVAGTMIDSIWELGTFRGFVMEIDHEHNYSTTWHSDENYHWHECSCGDITDSAIHKFGSWVDVTAACPHVSGSHYRVCADCGYVDTQPYSVISQSYTGWWNNAAHHWHECSCGEIEDKAAHQYIDGICSVCGYVGEGIGDITWALKDGTLTISGTGPMADYDLFEASWYPNCDDIKTVIIEPGITSIGSGAFYYCSELLSVTIPDSVTTIGDFAFFSCEKLMSVTIPDSVTTIGERAFARCSALVSVEIPGDVTAIGECAFIGCENLTTVTIPGNVMTMGDAVFAECSNLTGITVAEENQYYSSSDGVLFDKDKTVLIQYPAGNERTSYSIPSSVISIRNLAFSGCSSLVSVTIPDSVINIEEEAFCENYSLEGIIVDKSNPYYSGDADGVLFNKGKTELLKYPAGNKRTSYTIPGSVTSIGYSAFSDCGNLTSVNIPDNVTSIGDYAFSGCSALTFTVIPSSVTSIGQWAFSLCGLTSVNIPDSVAHIGGYAFFCCNGLTSVTIPNSLTGIEESVFEGCNNLKSVTIPNSVTSIGGYAFGDCINLTDINYAGTEEEWTSVNIGDDALPEGAAIHFVSAPVVSAGDLNGDSAVDVTDMACLYTWLSTGKNEGSLDTKAFQKIADVNGDGDINILDYQALYELIKQHP